MHWASTLVENEDLDQAIIEAAENIRQRLADRPVDLVLAFASVHHRERYNQVAALVKQQFQQALVLGCSAGGVIGASREVEEQAAFSLTAAHLPDVTLTPLQMEQDRLPGDQATTAEWEQYLRVQGGTKPQFLLLADPYSFDPQTLLQSLDRIYPDSVKIGGLASGAGSGRAHALFLDNVVFRTGLVGVAMHGNITLDTVVAQGCRPIGEPLFITATEQNRILSLDGKSPVTVLQNLYQSLTEYDQALTRNSLCLGIAMHGDRQSYHQGDFLIRNILGVDPNSGALSVAAYLPPNSVVQFHLRDAHASAEDLETLLQQHATTEPATRGALLFSCLGRGINLYGSADHDSRLFNKHLGPVPLGGFFCNGEIGPVQGSTFLHGFTSAFALFRPLSP